MNMPMGIGGALPLPCPSPDQRPAIGHGVGCEPTPTVRAKGNRVSEHAHKAITGEGRSDRH